ncbi:hypothetical protein FACS189442_2560 [Spirochaetia bacterium]|nr:hypothetical protein FACS189442_2560 [Spirochaetia bacterium]
MKKLAVVLSVLMVVLSALVFVACEWGTYDTSDGRSIILESGGKCTLKVYNDGSFQGSFRAFTGTYTLNTLTNTIKVITLTVNGETITGSYDSLRGTITIGKATYSRAVLDDGSEIDFDFSGTWDVK